MYDGYEVVDARVEGRGGRRVYRPLREYPALFAEFARLDLRDDGQAALSWARKYGVLGLEYGPSRRPITAILLPERGWPSEPSASRERDSVEAFVREARIAADVLALYKAAKKPNAQSERKWPAEHGPPEKIRNREVIERMDVYEIYRPERKAVGSRFWTEWGLDVCAAITQTYVSEYCRPMMYRRGDGEFERGWGFDNLLGAMWLQMYWMLTAADDELRCLNPRCPDPDFVLSQGEAQGVGRPRKYCSETCKNQVAQRRRRAGHAKPRTTKPQDADAESAAEDSAFRRALRDARGAVIRGDA